jgi:ArsR family transcriptional regulator
MRSISGSRFTAISGRSRVRATSDRERLVAVLRAIAHPLRLRIVALLCESDHHVNALAERLDAPQAIVSQQLRILRSEGLVAATRAGGFARYRLEGTALRGLIRFAEACANADDGAPPGAHWEPAPMRLRRGSSVAVHAGAWAPCTQGSTRDG